MIAEVAYVQRRRTRSTACCAQYRLGATQRAERTSQPTSEAIDELVQRIFLLHTLFLVSAHFRAVSKKLLDGAGLSLWLACAACRHLLIAAHRKDRARKITGWTHAAATDDAKYLSDFSRRW